VADTVRLPVAATVLGDLAAVDTVRLPVAATVLGDLAAVDTVRLPVAATVPVVLVVPVVRVSTVLVVRVSTVLVVLVVMGRESRRTGRSRLEAVAPRP
jgi:hypothetical protein